MNEITEFKCEKCNKIFTKGWSDEEAEKEYSEAIYNTGRDERCLICEDCFKLFHKWLSTLTEEDHKKIKYE